VFFSSDQVFKGNKGYYSEDSPVDPITEYGRQKAEVESQICSVTKGKFLAIRLCRVFSLQKSDNSLLDGIARDLLALDTVKAAYDQIYCPMLIDDFIKIVSWLQSSGINGIVNVCSSEAWSRYDLTTALAIKMGIDASKIQKVSLDKIMTDFKWPKNTSMISNLLPPSLFSFTPVASCIEQVANNWKINKDRPIRGHACQ
jgi:dTDP-4-dehydrorhamnose reductase